MRWVLLSRPHKVGTPTSREEAEGGSLVNFQRTVRADNCSGGELEPRTASDNTLSLLLRMLIKCLHTVELTPLGNVPAYFSDSSLACLPTMSFSSPSDPSLSDSSVCQTTAKLTCNSAPIPHTNMHTTFSDSSKPCLPKRKRGWKGCQNCSFV